VTEAPGENVNEMTNSAFVDTSDVKTVSIVEQGKEREFLNMLLENLDVGVAILDKDMRYRMLSNASFRQLRIDDGEVKLGDPLSRMHEVMMKKGLMTPEIMSKNALSEEVHRVNADTGIKTTSRLVKLGDGTTHRFCRQVLDNGYTISVASDVSELVEKDHLLESSLALGRSGIWTYDFKTKVYVLSKSLHAYFGKEGAERVLKTGFLCAVIPEDRHILKNALQNIVQTGDRFEIDLRCTTHTGAVRWSKSVVELVRDEAGRPLRLRAFVRDTEREHRQQAQLENLRDDAIHASKAKSEFLANMSHEIRTPMNGILGMAELLGMSNIDDRQREYVDVITNSASALLCIINDILDFSKIEAGAMHLDPTPFDLKSSINDITALLITNAQEKGLELIINYPQDLPHHFIGDAGRIRQVLTNLVGNAIKFTGEGHVRIDVGLEISAEDPNIASVSLDVTDTGIGIAPDSLQAVFEKFTQADGSTTRVYGGTGLGLAITKRIAEMMDGTIDVSSEVGVGSTFGIKIPLEIDLNAKVEPLNIAALTGKHALIVDDIDVNRTILGDQVSGWGMTSHAVCNGVEAADALKSAAQPGGKPFDVILLDFLMPGVNGRELASMLSKQSSVPIPPIVMLSSCDQSVSSEELRSIGIETYLVKPVRERRLFETLGRVIAKKTSENAPQPPSDESAAPSSQSYQPIQIMSDPAVSVEDEVQPSLDLASEDQNDAASPESSDVGGSNMSLIDSMLADLSTPSAAQSPASQTHAAQPVASTPTPSASKPVTPAPTPPAPSEVRAKQEILVAEDFPLNRDVVRLMLAESPFEPVFAENGKLASELYISEPDRFPLVLMDVSMPVMDGFQATKVIREWETEQGRSERPVPIIALTGHALKNDRQECLDAGMNHYLTKPVKQTELLETLEHYSGRAVSSAAQAA